MGDHGHSGHSHPSHSGPAAGSDPKNQSRVGWAALLTGGFMLAEVVGGFVSGSLALLADAGHMLTDTGSLALAWLAFRVSRRPADWRRTYGFHRFQVLAGYTNGLTLFFVALAIVWEAAHRLQSAPQVLAGPMLAIAVAGLAVNITAFFVLHGADRDNVNVRGAMLHVIGDLLGSGAAIAAALVILWTGWTPIDPLLSVLVAVLILRSAWFLVRQSGRILLEAAPEHVDVRDVRRSLIAEIEGLEDVHHVHAWSLTEERPMITLHARIASTEHPDRINAAVKTHLREHFDIDHATVEIEIEDCTGETAPRAAAD